MTSQMTQKQKITQHNFNPHILREYDIRGTYGESLSGADALELGHRFGTWVKQQMHQDATVIVGRDGRLSSPELFLQLCQGLQEAGVNVIDCGVGPTPMLYYGTKITPAFAGIMITGSHNPKDDNGFKITLRDDPFFGEQIKALDLQEYIPSQIMGTLEHIDIVDRYVSRLLESHQQPNSSRERRLKIAWDAGNGAGGEIVEKLAEQIDANHILLNTTIDGTFPNHHPDPSVEENLVQLRQAIAENECDIGIAFDGDADRIGVLDAKGRIFWGDQLLMVLARALIAEIPNAIVIADVKSSQGFFDLVTELGGTALLSCTGHSLVKKMMKQTGAHLSGEMSGHIFYADQYYGYDDGLYAAIRFINIIQASPLTSTQIYDQLPQFHATPEMRIPCSDNLKFKVIETIQQHLRDADLPFIDIDGIRLANEDGWWLLRASNTQPVIVARCEGKTPEGLENLKNQLRQILEVQAMILPC